MVEPWVWAFLGGMFGTRGIEVVAALCGLANVGLIIRRSLWNYPFGFTMVTLYAIIFLDYRLYSDALLQVYFFVIQGFGLWWWLNGRQANGRIEVVRATAREMLVVLVGCAVGLTALGGLMDRLTDAALPWWDAAVAVLSVAAQTLMARRRLESWLFWIAVDVVAIGVFTARGLVPTAALYSVFLCLSIAGLVGWARSMRPAGAVA